MISQIMLAVPGQKASPPPYHNVQTTVLTRDSKAQILIGSRPGKRRRIALNTRITGRIWERDTVDYDSTISITVPR